MGRPCLLSKRNEAAKICEEERDAADICGAALFLSGGGYGSAGGGV